MYVTPSWKEPPNKKILDLPLISWGLFSLYLSCNPYPSSRRREGITYALINVWWQNWKPRAHRLIVGVAFCKSGWGNRYLPHRARPMLSIVSRGRPLSLLLSARAGKGKRVWKKLVHTSFRIIPLDSWGTILSVYYLCRGAAFRDLELNTLIKTVLSWRWIIQL